MNSPVSRTVRTLARRVALAVGLGYVLLLVVPVTVASLLLIGAGHQLAAVGLLGVSVGVTVFTLLAVGFVWLLVRAALLTLSSFVTIQRRRVLYWAVDLETAHWWARLVRPSERFAFLDSRSVEETVEEELDRLRTKYVSGELSVVEFERRVDRLLWTETRARTSGGVDTIEPMSAVERGDARRDSLDGERIVR